MIRVANSIFKLSEPEKTPNQGIFALQKGMSDLITLLMGGVQLVPDKDQTGLLNYVQRYLNNVASTYQKESNKITGIVDQYTIDNFIVLRDKFMKVMAGTNLADFIKSTHGNQPWFPKAYEFGEKVKAAFEPAYESMRGVKEDEYSLASQGAAIGSALTKAGSQFGQLCQQYNQSRPKKVEASERVRRAILVRHIKQLSRKV